MARHNEEWESTKTELYAEDWWKKHGFSVRLHERFLSKSIYEVSKDGVKTLYEVPFTVKKPKKFMEGFSKLWDLMEKTKDL